MERKRERRVLAIILAALMVISLIPAFALNAAAMDANAQLVSEEESAEGSNPVMSKKLENFTAKYCCMTKLDPVSSRLLKEEIDSMINSNMYDQFFEDSLVQMIMFHDFQLSYVDIAGQKWSEVDTVDDLLTAQEIHRGN